MKVIRWLDRHFEEFFLVVLCSIMVLATISQVFMRFVLGSSLGWSEELARYCFIWLIFLGVSYGVKKQQHLKIDLMLLLLKDRGKVMLNMIANFIFLLFAFIVIFYGSGMAYQIMTWGQTSPGMNIPMGFVYLAAPVGMGLTIIRLIQQLIKQFFYLSGKNKDEEEVITDRMVDNCGKEETIPRHGKYVEGG